MTNTHEYKTAFTKETVELVHHVDHKDKLFRTVEVLEAMLWGVEAKLGGLTVRLAETKKGGICPVIINEDDLILGQPDLPLSTFSEMVDAMTDKEYEEMRMQTGFSKALVGSRKKREKVGA